MDCLSVLVLCVHTSARSPTAEGLLRDRYGDCYEVRSAGVGGSAAPTGLGEERRADVRRGRDAPAGWIDDTFGGMPVPV